MGITSLLNRPNFNRQTGVVEFKGSTRDGEAVVNQFGIHNHGAGAKNNAIELAADVATMVGGPVGLVANGANAVRKAFKGEWGGALKSVGKGIASMIPGLNLVVGGVSALKNGADLATHGMGAMEQKMKGGYQNQTRMASMMFGGNFGASSAMAYGGNHQMMGGAYGNYGYGAHGAGGQMNMQALMIMQGGGYGGYGTW